jgi:hypothetical protein
MVRKGLSFMMENVPDSEFSLAEGKHLDERVRL